MDETEVEWFADKLRSSPRLDRIAEQFERVNQHVAQQASSFQQVLRRVAEHSTQHVEAFRSSWQQREDDEWKRLDPTGAKREAYRRETGEEPPSAFGAVFDLRYRAFWEMEAPATERGKTAQPKLEPVSQRETTSPEVKPAVSSDTREHESAPCQLSAPPVCEEIAASVFKDEEPEPTAGVSNSDASTEGIQGADVNNVIGGRIRELREKCALTQDELAYKVGISYRVLGDHERGIKMPRGGTLERYQQVFQAFGHTL